MRFLICLLVLGLAVLTQQRSTNLRRLSDLLGNDLVENDGPEEEDYDTGEFKGLMVRPPKRRTRPPPPRPTRRPVTKKPAPKTTKAPQTQTAAPPSVPITINVDFPVGQQPPPPPPPPQYPPPQPDYTVAPEIPNPEVTEVPPNETEITLAPQFRRFGRKSRGLDSPDDLSYRLGPKRPQFHQGPSRRLYPVESENEFLSERNRRNLASRDYEPLNEEIRRSLKQPRSNRRRLAESSESSEENTGRVFTMRLSDLNMHGYQGYSRRIYPRDPDERPVEYNGGIDRYLKNSPRRPNRRLASEELYGRNRRVLDSQEYEPSNGGIQRLLRAPKLTRRLAEKLEELDDEEDTSLQRPRFLQGPSRRLYPAESNQRELRSIANLVME